MGMSMHVTGFRAPDDRWHKMKAIWDACHEAGVDKPFDVWEFFGNEPPDPSGVEVDIDEAVSEFSGDSSGGYEVDVRRLPKDLHVIRFYNSW